MNGWMSAQAVKSPPEKVCVPGCECNTVMLFHLFGKNIPAHLPQPPPPRPPLPRAVVCTAAKKTRRDSRCPVCWLECLLNVKGKGDKKNETETEWTLCRWILVKDASRVCDSVINLVKLRTEEPQQQNQRLLTEKGTQRSHFFAVPQNLKCIQMDSGGATVYITWMETYYHKIVMRRSLFFPPFAKIWHNSAKLIFCFPDGTNGRCVFFFLLICRRIKRVCCFLPVTDWLTAVQGDHLAPGVTDCHRLVKMLIWILITRSHRQGNYRPSPLLRDSPHMAKSRGRV